MFLVVLLGAALLTGGQCASLRNESRKLNIEWAEVFPGLASKTVPQGCSFLGKPICCSALEEPPPESTDLGVPLHEVSGLQSAGACVTKKEYFASPYEIRHLLKAEEIALVKDQAERHGLLLDFISSAEEVRAAQRWLERVKFHQSKRSESNGRSHGHFGEKRSRSYAMKRLRAVRVKEGKRSKEEGSGHRRTSVDRESVHADDAEYMSKFIITTTCANGQTKEWVEWIEPLSVHGRHPFGMSYCQYNGREYGASLKKSGVEYLLEDSIMNVDYILLQSAKSLPHYELTPSETVRKTKKYLFDAGTSRFDSSLFWLTCAFSQMKIDFGNIFGWEMSLLQPAQFWEHVPPRWKPLYHFFNKGITASPTDADSVQTLTKQLKITKDDFVAFKLDIDTPEVELPIVSDLLDVNSDFADYIDEFFLELHFRCEIMMSCGWGDKMPEEFVGIKLDRPGALKVFRDLRLRGVRAHFWP